MDQYVLTPPSPPPQLPQQHKQLQDATATKLVKRRGRKPGLHSTVVQRNAANARERSRMRVLSTAFMELKSVLPWVPQDTKLSKLDTLKLASGYITYLKHILDDPKAPVPENNVSSICKDPLFGTTFKGSTSRTRNVFQDTTHCQRKKPQSEYLCQSSEPYHKGWNSYDNPMDSIQDTPYFSSPSDFFTVTAPIISCSCTPSSSCQATEGLIMLPNPSFNTNFSSAFNPFQKLPAEGVSITTDFSGTDAQ